MSPFIVKVGMQPFVSLSLSLSLSLSVSQSLYLYLSLAPFHSRRCIRLLYSLELFLSATLETQLSTTNQQDGYSMGWVKHRRLYNDMGSMKSWNVRQNRRSYYGNRSSFYIVAMKRASGLI